MEKGIEIFCPLVKARHQWSDRVKTVEEPLFKSVFFVKIREEQRTDVRKTEGVVNFVYNNGKPIYIKEKMIQAIRQLQQAYQQVIVLEMNKQGEKEQHIKQLQATGCFASLSITGLNVKLFAYSNQPDLIEASTDKN